MNSSTSSSDNGKLKRGVLILVTVLVFFSAIEVAMRVILVRISKDLNRFSEYPAKAERLHLKGGSNFALIGNSATEAGIDPLLMEHLLRDAGIKDASAEMFVADASGITTWYYMVKNYFVSSDRVPRYFVINYSGISLVRDGHLEVGRLAQYFTKVDDWREVILNELSTSGDILEFVLSLCSKTFAFSGRLRDRLLNVAIYDYKGFARENNQAALDHERMIASKKGCTVASTPPDYARFERFLRMIKRSGAMLIVVAFPTQLENGESPYAIDPKVRSLVESNGFVFKDLRIAEGLENSMYEDDIHLSAEGRTIYTRLLAGEIFKTLSELKKDWAL